MAQPQPQPQPQARAGGAFSRLWLGHASANLGFGLFAVAAPLAAASVTTSPLLVAGVSVALGLPWLLVALPAGALVDRSDRRRAGVAASLARAVLLGALATTIATGWLSIWALYVVAFAFATGGTVGHAAMDALVPQVVEPAALQDANRKIKITSVLNKEFVGSAGAGALAAVSLAAPFAAGALLYALSAGGIGALRGSYRVPRPPGVAGGGLARDVREGLRFVWSSPVLRSLGLMLAVIVTAVSMHLAVLVLYVVDPAAMGLSEFGYGLLFAGKAAGAIATGLALRRATRVLGEAGLIRLAVAGAVVLVAAPGLTASVGVIAASMVLGGAAEMAYVVTSQTIKQRVSPPGVLGRVSAAYALITWGPVALGAALAGVIGEVFGVRAVFLVAGLLVALAAPVLLRPVSRAAVNAALQRPARQ